MNDFAHFNPPHSENRRFVVLAVFLLLALVGLLVRTVYLHVFNQSFLQAEGNARAVRQVAIPAHRGLVVDRRGEPLAISTPVDSVWVSPKQFVASPAVLKQLSNLLGLSSSQIQQKITAFKNKDFTYLRRQVSPEVAAKIRALNLKGVHFQSEYRRYYPAGEVTAHLLGFTDIDDIGQEGLELVYDEWLRGVPGHQRVLKDRLGRIIKPISDLVPARPGQDLVLSIDYRLQYLAYRELKQAVTEHQAKSGTLVILDVQTGEILAMVNQPSYNPNSRRIVKDGRHRNRAVTDVFEPGSAVKPFTVLAALGSGQYRPDTKIETSPGWMRVAGHVIRDIHDYGLLDVTGVIQKSSNVGAAKIALTLPPYRLWETFRQVGLGDSTGSHFPGEMIGTVRHPKEWYLADHATFAFGYGLSVTALQLAQAYAVLGSGGIKRPVSLLALTTPLEGESVLDAQSVAQVLAMLETTVQAGGTGTLAQVDGYRIGGKTGTVRKLGAKGYEEQKYLSLFAGLAPIQNPRIAMVVVVDEPSTGEYYGGLVAAPVFARVANGALRLLNISPEGKPWVQIASIKSKDRRGGF